MRRGWKRIQGRGGVRALFRRELIALHLMCAGGNVQEVEVRGIPRNGGSYAHTPMQVGSVFTSINK
jgi:hypothetical protein